MGQHGKYGPLVKQWVTFVLALSGATPLCADPAVVAQLSQDLDGDGLAELALVIGESDLSLAIFGQTEANGPVALRAEGPTLGWMGSLNEPPRLAVTPQGSLQVTSSNWGIGRHKWEMTLTIAHREGQYRVAGLTFGEVDTLQEYSTFSCDANLLTGDVILSGPGEDLTERRDKTIVPALPISEWTPDLVRAVCPNGDH